DQVGLSSERITVAQLAPHDQGAELIRNPLGLLTSSCPLLQRHPVHLSAAGESLASRRRSASWSTFPVGIVGTSSAPITRQREGRWSALSRARPPATRSSPPHRASGAGTTTAPTAGARSCSILMTKARSTIGSVASAASTSIG